MLGNKCDSSSFFKLQLYKNIADCKEEEIEDTLKGGDDGEERRQTGNQTGIPQDERFPLLILKSEFSLFIILSERNDNQNNPVAKNIYQLSWLFYPINMRKTKEL